MRSKRRGEEKQNWRTGDEGEREGWRERPRGGQEVQKRGNYGEKSVSEGEEEEGLDLLKLN